jgi:uncharacterized protein (DUF433 family)
MALMKETDMELPDFLIDHPDGEIRLTGHRIGLYTVVRDYKEGRSVREIAEEYPTLSADLIRQVIAFYEENRSQVDAYVDSCEKELMRQAALGPGPGTLQVRELLDRIQQADQKQAADPDWARLSAVEKLRRIQKETNTESPQFLFEPDAPARVRQ